MTGLLVLLLLSPLLFWRGLFDFANLPQTVFIQTSSMLLLSVWLARQGWTPRAICWSPGLIVSGGAFLAWSLLSLAWAHHRYEGWETWLHWTACFTVFIIATDQVRTRQAVLRLLAAIALSGVAVALIGLAQALLGFSWIPQVAPPSATFANRNMASDFVVMTLPASLALWAWSRRSVARCGWATGCAIGAAFLFQTGTRAAWLAGLVILATFAGFATYGWWSEKRRRGEPRAKPAPSTYPDVEAGAAPRTSFVRRHGAAVLLAGCVLILLANAGPHGWGGRFGGTWQRLRKTATDATAGVRELSKDTAPTTPGLLPAEDATAAQNSLSFRLTAWRNAVEMIRARPVRGWGLGNFKIFYPQFRRAAVAETMSGETRMVRDLHNDWLQIAVETGLVGQALLLAMAALLIRTMLGQLRRMRSSHDIWLVAASAGGMAAFAVVAIFSFPMERALPPLLLAGYAAVLFGIPARRDAGAATTCTTAIRIPRTARILAVGIAAVVLLVVVGWSVMRVGADFHFARLHQAERREDHAGVAKSAGRVLAWNPFRNEVFSFLARALLYCGEPAAAAEAGEEYLRSEPFSLSGRLNLALAYGQLGRDTEAQAILEEALKPHPDSASVHNGLGNIALRQRRADDALREFFFAVECAPDNPRLHFNLGLAALAKGMPEDAERAFRMAIWLDPTWEPPYAMLDRLQKNESPAPPLPAPLEATADAPGTR